MKALRNLVMLLTTLLCLSASLNADIEKPVKGKQYKLAKNHGPFVIMVAGISDVDDERRRIEGGLSAQQAADEIVFALREKGIPAYTYTRDEEMGEIASPKASEAGGRKYIAQKGSISVMAGNFPSINDKKAQQALKYVQEKFDPAFLKEEGSGGILPKTPGRPSPFRRAFITVNPLWEGEVRDAEQDTFITELNAGQKYSLLQNKARYSLVVATFHGGSVMQVGNTNSTKALGFFDKTFGKSLDDCAENAIQFTDRLRNAKKYGYDTNYEAWVYHDKYKSLVTIGSFNSPDDPRIRTLATQLGGKIVRHPKTGEDILVGESFTIPKVMKKNELPSQSWVFDAHPKVMEVPRVQ